MKTRYKYIHFVKQPDEEDTWDCRNNRHENDLGVVYFYHPWETFVLIPEDRTIFSADCLLDIADFLGQLNEGKK